jgi:hypothetical protein
MAVREIYNILNTFGLKGLQASYKLQATSSREGDQAGKGVPVSYRLQATGAKF